MFGYFTPRRLRLLSGLVMFVYIAVHLLNHGLGIISLALAERGLRLEMAFWRTPIMTTLLYGAVAMHFVLALRTLYNRRDWRLPWFEHLRLAAAGQRRAADRGRRAERQRDVAHRRRRNAGRGRGLTAGAVGRGRGRTCQEGRSGPVRSHGGRFHMGLGARPLVSGSLKLDIISLSSFMPMH